MAISASEYDKFIVPITVYAKVDHEARLSEMPGIRGVG